MQRKVKKNEVYLADLTPTIGHEQTGKRPIVVVSIQALAESRNLCLVIPGTKKENVPRDYPFNIFVPAGTGGLNKDTAFLVYQLRTLDVRRLEKHLGVLPREYMAGIERALIKLCNIDPEEHL